MINFQFHVIARIDDTMQVMIDHICIHDSFPNCLKPKLNWSKNVGNERNAPWQIVMGSMDTTYCFLVSMAIWMEINMRANANATNLPYLFSFSDDAAVPSGGLKARCIAQTIFDQKVFNMEQCVLQHCEQWVIVWKSQHSEICSCTRKELWLQQG
jgi:hypothetical protein